MDFEKILNELIEKGKANNNRVLDDDLTYYYANDSEDYETLKLELSNYDIDVVDSIEDLDDFEEDDLDDDELVVEPDLGTLGDLASEEVDLKEVERDIEIISQTVSLDDPVKMYLKDIGAVPLLTISEETELAKEVVAGRPYKNKLEAFKKGEIEMTPEEEDEANEWAFKAQRAKDKLVRSNLRLVVSIAKKYINRGLLLLDLIQEGNVGLMKAVDKFEVDLGYKFSTYATWWIRQAITRAVADQARTIRIPVHMVETINKLVRVQRQLVQELSREPTPEEVAERMETTVEKVQQIQKIAQEPISLEAPVGEEEDSSLGDFISDPTALDPLEFTQKEMLKREIDEVLATLTEREEKVLRMRFGLLDGRQRTLEEVGREFGVTRERIRQIEAKALRKLKHPSRSRKLRDYMNKR